MVRSNRELQFRHLVCTRRYVKLLKSYEKLISIKTNRPLEMSHLFLSHIGDAVPAAKLEVLGLYTCIAYPTFDDPAFAVTQVAKAMHFSIQFALDMLFRPSHALMDQMLAFIKSTTQAWDQALVPCMHVRTGRADRHNS